MSENVSLVKRVETAAIALLDDERIRESREAAKYALSIVVHDEATLAEASQLSLRMVAARKLLKEKRDPYAKVLREATAMLGTVFGPDDEAFAEAGKYADEQVKQYHLAQQRERDRLQREADERRRKAEAEARQREAERKALEAQGVSVPAPPPVAPPVQQYVPPPEVKVRVDGGTTSLRWDLKCELVAPHECEPTWLRLDTTQAIAWARDRVGAEGLEKREGSEIVLRGVRYWYEPGTHKSGR